MQLAIPALAAVALLGAIQLIPVDRTNPPERHPFPVPGDVDTALRRVCYDCHSNETRWPWYSRIAPFSWIVSRDVHAAREKLNFSTFGDEDSRKKIERWKETWRQVDEGGMAPWYYLTAHDGAELTDTEKRRIRIWALGEANEEFWRSGAAPAPAAP